METDAGGDPDDEGSLVRLLMFADQFELEAIIDDRSNSQIEGRSTYQNMIRDAGGDGEDLVEAYLTDYGAIHSNLLVHDARFPNETFLKSITVLGTDAVDTGRDAIIAAVDRDDPRPVWYGNWGSNSGTTSNLKRALDYVQSTRSPEAYEAFASRLRIASLDGNNSTRQGHIDVIPLHIETGYPDINGRWYHQFDDITATAGGFNINRDVKSDHGELGAHYTTQKEGDSWCFVHLQSQAIGLSIPSRVTWGGWGGRYAGQRIGANFPNNAFFWNDQSDTWNGTTSRNNTVARYADDMQRHFAARLDWALAENFSDANHPPVAIVNGDNTGEVIRLFAQPGQNVVLDASASTDPDGDSLGFEWFRYPEADSYPGTVSVSGADSPLLSVQVPNDANGTELHFYLEVADDGEPSPMNGDPQLRAYRRVILVVRSQLRILPLGDSITDGAHWSDNANGAYRRALWNQIQGAGWNVDFVGAKSNGGSGMDPDHAGYIGYRVDELYGDADGSEPNVDLVTQLATYQPDIILLLIGTNDALQNTDLPNIDHRMLRLLNLIQKHRPEVLVVMGNVPPVFKSNFDPGRIDAINAQFPRLLDAAYDIGLWRKPIDTVSLLDSESDFNDDLVHPNQQGDDKLGAAFFSVLETTIATGTVNLSPPTTPVNLNASGITSEGCVLTWSAGQNSGPVAQYEVRLNGNVIASTSSTSYAPSGLSPHSAYVFSVRAIGLNNDISPWSSDLTISTAAQPLAFLEEEGQLTIEAEHFQRATDQGDPWFMEASSAGFVGEGYMNTLDDGSPNSNWETADDLSYDIQVSTSGDYAVWLRVSQNGGAANSAHVGIDGTGGTIDNGGGSGWYWVKHASTFALDGTHTLHLRRREDGYKVDRILLTNDPAFIPVDNGPEENARSTEVLTYTFWADAAIDDETQRTEVFDPDGDGLSNLMEYALDLDPVTASTTPTTSQLTGAPQLELSFNRARSELVYTLEASDDLSTWTTIATNPGNVSETVTVTDSVTAGPSHPSRFLRLRVTE